MSHQPFSTDFSVGLRKCDPGNLTSGHGPQIEVSTETSPRPKTTNYPPGKGHRDIPLSSNFCPTENRLVFVPLKPQLPSKEKLEAESQRAIHHPLPRALETSKIFRGRRKFVGFSLSCPTCKKKEDITDVKKRKKVRKEREDHDDSDEEVSVSHKLRIFTLDQSEEKLLGVSDKVLGNGYQIVVNVAKVMADLTSNCVVLLGNSRLEEAEAKKLLKAYHDKSKNLKKLEKDRK